MTLACFQGCGASGGGAHKLGWPFWRALLLSVPQLCLSLRSWLGEAFLAFQMRFTSLSGLSGLRTLLSGSFTFVRVTTLSLAMLAFGPGSSQMCGLSCALEEFSSLPGLYTRQPVIQHQSWEPQRSPDTARYPMEDRLTPTPVHWFVWPPDECPVPRCSPLRAGAWCSRVPTAKRQSDLSLQSVSRNKSQMFEMFSKSIMTLCVPYFLKHIFTYLFWGFAGSFMNIFRDCLKSWLPTTELFRYQR